jgi:hypothetical protein
MIARALRRLQVAGAVLRLLWMWPRIAVGAGLGRRTDESRRSGRRWVPSSPGGVVVATRPRLSDFPKLTHWRVGPYGWRARLRLRPGDTPEAVAKAAPALRQSFRAAVVSVRPQAPGYVELVVLRRDPLATPPVYEPAVVAPAVVRLAVDEAGEPWCLDFRKYPHALIAGATGSGKSNLPQALVKALAPTDAGVVGIDCKFGLELSLVEPRLTALATDPTSALDVLDRVHRLVESRAGACRAAGVRSVWELPEGHPARRSVFVIVDEVAELILLAGPGDPLKEVKQKLGAALLRAVQLDRFAGVAVLICGQRFGSDLGGPVTAIKSQLAARLVGRCSDTDTVKMSLGDIGPDAVEACTSIDPATPGVMISAGGPFGWERIRSLYVPTAEVVDVARRHADRTPSWAELEDVGHLRAVA